VTPLRKFREGEELPAGKSSKGSKGKFDGRIHPGDHGYYRCPDYVTSSRFPTNVRRVREFTLSQWNEIKGKKYPRGIPMGDKSTRV